MNVDDLRGKIPEDGSFKLRALHTAVKLLLEFFCHLENLSASYHIFKPVLTTLKRIDVEKYPRFLQEDIQSIISKTEEMAHKKLHFLVKEKKKPKALRLYEPRIEEVWVPSLIQVGSIYRFVMYIVKVTNCVNSKTQATPIVLFSSHPSHSLPPIPLPCSPSYFMYGSCWHLLCCHLHVVPCTWPFTYQSHLTFL